MILPLILIGFVTLFGFVLLVGAPYLPTHKAQANRALDLLQLEPGQTLLELGCGDGRIAKLAAKRGLKVIGYELNPFLVIVAVISNLKYRHLVKISWANYWKAQWPKADGIFVFLLDRYMEKLDNKIIHEYKARPVKLVSYAFEIKGKKAQSAERGIFLYEYN